jgi:NMD protein affecting ribosome stability and mRNA decay
MKEFEKTSCASCGIAFCVPPDWLRARRQDVRKFFCPNGHELSFRESTADKLQREISRQRQENARLVEEAAAAKDAARAALMREGKARKDLDRVRTRIHGGACPDCNRTFANLARHMATKHRANASALHCSEAGHA